MLDCGVWWWRWVWWLGGYSGALGCCNGWGREVIWQGRENNIKKLFTRWTVTVYICTITVNFARHLVYLDILHKLMWKDFGVKCVNWSTFCILVEHPWTGVDALIYFIFFLSWSSYQSLLNQEIMYTKSQHYLEHSFVV